MAGSKDTSDKDVNDEVESQTGPEEQSSEPEVREESVPEESIEDTSEATDADEGSQDATDTPVDEADPASSGEDTPSEPLESDPIYTEAVMVEGDESDAGTDDTSEPEVVEPMAPVPATIEKETVVVKRGGFLMALLGGAVCFAAGFAVAQYGEGTLFGGTSQETEARIAELDQRLNDEESETAQLIESLMGDLETLRSDLTTQIDEASAGNDMDAALQPLADQLAALEGRVNTVEARPVEEAIVSPEGSAAYERQLEEMQTMLDNEVERLREATRVAEEEQVAAAKANAMRQLREAVDEGEPYASILSDYSGEVPPAVADAAEDGVASIDELQASFEAAARRALNAAVRQDYEAGEESWTNMFLRTQLGLRSTAPKEGDDADAALSRAEAAVREADFATAVAEVETLSEAGQDAMADWVNNAKARLAVTSALDDMQAE